MSLIDTVTNYFTKAKPAPSSLPSDETELQATPYRLDPPVAHIPGDIPSEVKQ